MHRRAEALLPIEIDEWQGHFGAVLQGAPDWEARGHLGNRGLFVLRELLQLLPSWEAVRLDISRFLEAALQASQALVGMIAGATLAHTPFCSLPDLDMCMLLFPNPTYRIVLMHHFCKTCAERCITPTMAVIGL